ncbi:MAG: DUF2935 domain-containing protein [Bacillota bacterium]
MFCYSVAFNINCVLRELIMWTEISYEHPIFIKNVAELSGKKLSKELQAKLNAVHESFRKLISDVRLYDPKVLPSGLFDHEYTKNQLEELTRRFLLADREFIQLINGELISHSKKDKVLLALLTHILQEQKYMYRLFSSLLRQI